MKPTKLLKSSALAALAASLAIAPLPAEASAQERRGWSVSNDNRSSARSERPSSRAESRQAQRVERQAPQRQVSQRQTSQRQAQRRQAPQRAERPTPRAEPARTAPVRGWSVERPVRSETVRTEGSRDWNRNGRDNDRSRDGNRAGRRDNDRDRERNWRDGRSDNDRDRSYGGRDRDRSYGGRDRDRTYNDRGWSTRDRDRNWSDRDRNWRDDRRGDHRRWDRRWRDNDRYDWQRWRNYNRSAFRIGRYYSPYRGYSYRRLNVGIYLDSLFYRNNYWISDPWRYRLPEVYGPYRWVRYYDDVLLVDTYSGEVVDVIYNFFW